MLISATTIPYPLTVGSIHFQIHGKSMTSFVIPPLSWSTRPSKPYEQFGFAPYGYGLSAFIIILDCAPSSCLYRFSWTCVGFLSTCMGFLLSTGLLQWCKKITILDFVPIILFSNNKKNLAGNDAMTEELRALQAKKTWDSQVPKP